MANEQITRQAIKPAARRCLVEEETVEPQGV